MTESPKTCLVHVIISSWVLIMKIIEYFFYKFMHQKQINIFL